MAREKTTPALPPGPLQKWDPTLKKLLGWQLYENNKDKDCHLIPVNDDRWHECDKKCWCVPVEDHNRKWMHNAADCREDYEDGFRKHN
jgi:hypothetical protein